MRKVDNNEALDIMRRGGEVKADVLTYLVRGDTLFYRDTKGNEHRSYTQLPNFLANCDARLWTVTKEPVS